MHARTLPALLWSDVRRGAAVAVVGCAAWSIAEFAITLWAARTPVSFGTALGFAALDLGLVVLAAVALMPAVGVACALARIVAAVADSERGRSWPGALAPRSASPRLVAWLWALVLAGLGFAACSGGLTYLFSVRFKAPAVIAVALAAAQLGLVALWGVIALALARALGALGRALGRLLGRSPHLASLDPLSSLGAALVVMAAAGTAGVLLLFRLLPAVEPVFPGRELVALMTFIGGLRAGVWLLAGDGDLLPSSPRQRRIVLASAVGVAVLVVALSVTWLGAHQDIKSLALTSSPPLEHVIDLVRRANDFDGDGYGSLLGENDCAPFDDAINPEVRDVPDNGVDENCNGSDFSLAALRAQPLGDRLELPEAYDRPWNILLLTVDTLRYDHTGFGGYFEKTGRDTTPNLDRLVRRSVSFDFSNAPSAGTMASVPAIVTSKFFHSGIALSGERRPNPPKVLADNLLIGEILESAGYRTGAILSHEYFNDWGLDQGLDTYDNDLGAVRDPFKVTSHELTDKALAWIAQNARRKWFLWVHYIDPHGRYVAHPGEPSYGTTEEDLYDGEIRYTDKHLGRLFEELWRMPGGDRTIIVITSDHGDGFMEHGDINHGFTLYREVLHVPLVFYIPDIEPRVVPGAVSPLDIVPTVADLVGAEVSEHSFEGESLVPQLFYGREDLDRVVFAETNAPSPQRAAVSVAYKLIYKLRENVYELYDLNKDPWEKTNVWGKATAAGAAMKQRMDAWLERVFYARDVRSNQAQAQRQWHLLDALPTVAQPVEGLTLDDDRIRVLGYELEGDEPGPGAKLDLIVYFQVVATPSADFRLQGIAWPADNVNTPPLRGRASLTADGILPTSHWRPGEYVRDRLPVRLPPSWSSERIALGLSLQVAHGPTATVAGPQHPKNASIARLGEVAIAQPAPPPAPPAGATKQEPAPAPTPPSQGSLAPQPPSSPTAKRGPPAPKLAVPGDR